MGINKFATAVNCMDGRIQTPVIECLRKKYVVEYVVISLEPEIKNTCGK